jgi:hypothetical protein
MAEKECIYYAWKEIKPRDPRFPFRAIYQSKLAVEIYLGRSYSAEGKIVKVRITEVKEV